MTVAEAAPRGAFRRDLGGSNAVWYDRGGHVVRIESRRMKLLAARARVPAPTFCRYYRHFTWHVCSASDRDVPFDDERWIEVAW